LISLFRLLWRLWVPLVVAVAVTVSGLAIIRMHRIFGAQRAGGDGASAPADRIVAFNPKRVLYEVFGPAETVGSISYLDDNAKPHRADFATLPWSYQVTTPLPSMFANVVAQGNSDVIACRITVNGEVRDDRSATGHDAQAFCLVKAA
jgi:Mycobacterium membrane protein